MVKISPLASVTATREVLESHGLTTKYSYGQNFLVNDGVLQRILRLSGVDATDVVLEVGPGIGTLTIPLLKEAGRVIAVERDADLIPVLRETCTPWWDHFSLMNVDALSLQLSDFPAIETPAIETDFDQHNDLRLLPSKFVSNLPYEVAATLVLDYFQRFPSIQSATVMVQKEVADRMMARPGSKNYGAYTVKLGLYARPVDSFGVGPGNFFPPPRVDSAVIRLDRTQVHDDADQPASPKLLELACLMADAAFANRRKTLSNSFKTFFSSKAYELRRSSELRRNTGRARSARMELGFSAEECEQLANQAAKILSDASIDSKRRGETLQQGDFLVLAQVVVDLLG